MNDVEFGCATEKGTAPQVKPLSGLRCQAGKRMHRGGGVAARGATVTRRGQATAADLISVAGHSPGAAPNTS